MALGGCAERGVIRVDGGKELVGDGGEQKDEDGGDVCD
jgi:hypothetical protein